MNLPLFISGRYLLGRKSHGVINLISAVSAAGMAIGTAALILILSVYNGFDRIIRDNLSSLDPDILVVPAEGKTFIPEGEPFERMYADPRIKSIGSVVTENVFISYSGHHGVALAKGVDIAFMEESGFGERVTVGKFELWHGEVPMALVGAGIASKMGVHPRFLNKMELWFPDRSGSVSLSNPASSLESVSVRPGGIFTVHADIDDKLVILPIETMRQLLRYDREVSALELRLAPGAELKAVIRDLGAMLGDGFEARDRFRQNPVLYKMMRYEKAAIFLILLFVVIIVAFSIFGSLSMLIIEKKEDIGTLRSMGAQDSLVRRIFVLEGWMISLAGLAIGLAVGVAAALLQQRFGLVRMPGNFLVSSYPVAVKWTDILLTATGVAATGYLIARLSVKYNKL